MSLSALTILPKLATHLDFRDRGCYPAHPRPVAPRSKRRPTQHLHMSDPRLRNQPCVSCAHGCVVPPRRHGSSHGSVRRAIDHGSDLQMQNPAGARRRLHLTSQTLHNLTQMSLELRSKSWFRQGIRMTVGLMDTVKGTQGGATHDVLGPA